MPNSDMESRVQNLLKQFQNQEVEAVGELPFLLSFCPPRLWHAPGIYVQYVSPPLMLINSIVRLTGELLSFFFVF